MRTVLEQPELKAWGCFLLFHISLHQVTKNFFSKAVQSPQDREIINPAQQAAWGSMSLLQEFELPVIGGGN